MMSDGSAMTDIGNSSLEKPRILITGGSGLLALNWYAAVRDEWDVVLGFHDRMPAVQGATGIAIDLESKERLLAILDAYAPEFVVHAAGCTSVESCEKAPDIARHVNIGLAENMAHVCRARGMPLVHISTDHLFSGADMMADEEAPIAPLNVYGKTKAEAELRVLEICPDALVIRTNFYGWGTGYRRSFSDVIIDALRQQRPITLFDDVYYTPILAESLAEAVHDLFERKASGVFNVVGSQRLTKYRFGMLLAEAFGLDPAPIRRGALSDLPGLVNRPRDMSLSNRKVRDFLGRDPGSVSDHLLRLREQEQAGLATELGKL